MTIIEALKSIINYPIEDNKVALISMKRGLIPEDETSQAVLLSKEFELATADVYLLLVSTPTIAEGGYQISMTDKGNMLELAKAIYCKHGEDMGFDTVVNVGTIKAVDLW